MFYWQKVKSSTGIETISVFTDKDKLYVADSEHPNFERIVAQAETGNASGIEDLFDIGRALSRKFEAVSDRVSISEGRVYLDGDVYDGAIADTILAFHEAEEEFEPLVNFMEKLLMNPNEHSREHAYRWLANKSFMLDSAGYVLAYKGVYRDGKGGYQSSASGYAIVDGVEHTSGQVPNNPGSVIELPRSQVTFDPAVGCSEGLHAGTWSYASTFAPVWLLVRIHPRDIVSVPTDAQDQKMRVSRYTVLCEVTAPVEGFFLGDEEEVDEWDRYAYDYDPDYDPDDDEDEDDLWDEDDEDFDDEDDDIEVAEQYQPWKSTPNPHPHPYTPGTATSFPAEPANLPTANVAPLDPPKPTEPWYSTRRWL